MFVQLLLLDDFLFRIIYFLPHPFWLVVSMEFFSLAGYFGIVWLLLGYAQKRFKKVFPALLLVFIFVDVFLKFAVARTRPYPSALDSIFPWESYSFPSGHAASSFAAAYILTRSKKQTKYIDILLWSLAALISFSRIYLGRHYAGDIVFGALIGLIIGRLVAKGFTIQAC